MTIRTNNWDPDTCNCSIKYKYDDAIPVEQRTYEIDIVNKSCSFHSNLLPNIPVTYSCIMDENRKKNNTLQFALDTLPSKLADIFTNPDGGTYTVLKAGLVFNFRLEGTAPNRVLYVSFLGTSLTQNEKNNIQTKLNERFGTGVVIIE